MKHLLKKHRMLSVGIFLAAVLSIIYAAILSPAGKRGDGKPCGICNGTDTTFFVSVSSGKFHSSQIYGNEYGVKFSGAGLGGNTGRNFCHERVKAAAENVKSGDRRDV